jgi:hypothetical protein
MQTSKRRIVVAPMAILNGTATFEMGTKEKSGKLYL